MRDMVKLFLIIMMFFLGFFPFKAPDIAANPPPTKGGILPSVDLPIPNESNPKSYLGLSGQGFFRIPQIRARVVIIEIFSLYCPACVKLAPAVKELYQMIENSAEFKGKIKLIGIGAGNSLYEVETFRNITEAPFPLFPDQDFAIHAALGEVRTPYFIAIEINGKGGHEVIYSEPGGFKGAKEFLELILSISGIK